MAVIIGMDPHKRSATIEVIDDRGDKIGSGKFGTDQTGYAEMLAAGRRFTDRIWAVEGCNGVGRHIAHRLVHDGETVLDVPAKLSAQVRVFATGNGRKTDPVDAYSVALAALRAPNLVRVQADPDLVVMGMLVDRRDELGRARTPDCQPASPAAVGAVSRRGQEVPVCGPGPCTGRDDQTAGHRGARPAAGSRSS
jgi:transposase